MSSKVPFTLEEDMAEYVKNAEYKDQQIEIRDNVWKEISNILKKKWLVHPNTICIVLYEYLI